MRHPNSINTFPFLISISSGNVFGVIVIDASRRVISLDDYCTGSNLLVRKNVSTDISRVLFAESRCECTPEGPSRNDGIEVEDKPLHFHLRRAATASSRNFDLSFTRRKHLAILPGEARVEPTKVNANKMDPPLPRIKLERRSSNFGKSGGFSSDKRKMINPKKRWIKRLNWND